MANFFVVGGKQRDDVANVSEGFKYEEALVLEVDIKNGIVEKKISYKTPLEYKASQEASIVFKSGHIDSKNGLLYLCTPTEVLIYKLGTFKLYKHISHPHFNDVHHVRPYKNNNLLVVSTGLDLLIEMDQNSKAVNYWDALNRELWNRYDPEIDYRKIASTKPHDSHPNFVSLVEENLWLTRFEQRDVINLNTGEIIDISIEKPHDGQYVNNKLYFTTVNGYIIITDPHKKRVLRRINLNKIGNPYRLNLGWCRGLHYINDEYVVVAFSKIRHTKYAKNIDWLKAFKKNVGRAISKKTRLVAYNLNKETIVDEINLENFEINGIFSVFKK